LWLFREAGIPSRLGLLWCATESMIGVWLWSPHGVQGLFPEARDALIWSRVTPPLGHWSGVYMDSLELQDVWNISRRRTSRESCLSSLCVRNWGPRISFPNSLILLYLVSIWVRGKVKRLLYNVCLTTSREGTQVIMVWSSQPRNFGKSVNRLGVL
jgi:hypothetical protein